MVFPVWFFPRGLMFCIYMVGVFGISEVVVFGGFVCREFSLFFEQKPGFQCEVVIPHVFRWLICF